MKFLCDRCKTRYAIADERVRGKILKIRCKNCSAVITVREGMDDTSARPEARTTAAPPTMPPPVTERPAPAALEEEWYVSKDGNQEGPFTLTEAQAWIAARPAADDLHCWNEGFDDWLPVEKVSHFRGLRGTARPARAATRPGLPTEPEPQPLFAATLAAIEAEAAAAAAAAPPPPAVGGAAAVAQLPPAKGPAPQPWSVPEPVAPTVAPAPDDGAPSEAAPRAPTPAVGVPTAPRAATPAVGVPALPALPRVPTPAVGVPALPGPGAAPRPALPTPFGAPRTAAAEAAPSPASPSPASPSPTPPPVPAPPPLPAPSLAAAPPLPAPSLAAAPPPIAAPPPLPAPSLAAAPPPAAAPPAKPSRTAARFDTGEAVDDDPPALLDDDEPGPSAAAAHDDDLDIGEVSRVVRLADLMAPPPAAAAPVAPMVTKPRAPTASVAAIGRGTGAVPALGAAAPALPPPVALDGEPLLPPAPAPRRRPVALYLAIGAAALGGIVATALIVSSGGEDTSGNATTGTGDDYSGIGFRPPDNRGTGASVGTGSGTAAGTGSGRPGPGTGRRPVGSGTGTGAGTAAGTGSGTGSGSGTATEVPVNPGLRELTPDDVFTMSRRMETGTRRCYERAIKADPFLKVSKIRATITVSATGGVSDVRLSDKADHPLGQCLSAAIKRWPFGPSKAGIVSEFAMVFEQK